jgi:hypothetical protein
MAIDPALDALIFELAASLDRPQRAAFEAAARAALAAAGCSGCGAAYRVLAPLQRGFWDPPDDQRIGAPRGPTNRRPSKLISAEAIGGPDPREGARDHRRFQAV